MDTEKIIKAAGNAELANDFGGLVFLGNVTEEPYTTDEIVAAYSGYDLHSVKDLIRRHEKRLKKFGRLNAYDTRKIGYRR